MRTYSITGKQIVILALLTAVFASSVVVFYDRVGSAWLGRLVGARGDNRAGETKSVAEITDPSVATDEKNNSEIYKAMSPGVVNITSTATNYVQGWFEVYPQESTGTGSGSVIDKEGHVLTNFHVVQGAQKLEVMLGNEPYKAEVIGADPDNDLAILKINAPAKDLTPIPLGNSNELYVGQKVLAIGNPFGLDRTLTRGIVSGLARSLHSEITGRLIEDVVQTDASINPGNSGGPLLDSRGRMIGINTMIYSPSGGSVGIGFAVPVETARRIIPDILAYGRVRKPKLGITPPIQVTARIADQLSLPVKTGLLVSEVVPGSAGDKAGMKGGTEPVRTRSGVFYLGGDVITSVDGKPVNTQDDLDRILNTKKIGDHVQVEVVRNGRRLKLDVELDEVPDARRRS